MQTRNQNFRHVVRKRHAFPLLNAMFLAFSNNCLQSEQRVLGSLTVFVSWDIPPWTLWNTQACGTRSPAYRPSRRTYRHGKTWEPGCDPIRKVTPHQSIKISDIQRYSLKIFQISKECLGQIWIISRIQFFSIIFVPLLFVAILWINVGMATSKLTHSEN